MRKSYTEIKDNHIEFFSNLNDSLVYLTMATNITFQADTILDCRLLDELSQFFGVSLDSV